MGCYSEVGVGLSAGAVGFGLWPGFVQQAVRPQIVQSSSSAGFFAGGAGASVAAEPGPEPALF